MIKQLRLTASNKDCETNNKKCDYHPLNCQRLMITFFLSASSAIWKDIIMTVYIFLVGGKKGILIKYFIF